MHLKPEIRRADYPQRSDIPRELQKREGQATHVPSMSRIEPTWCKSCPSETTAMRGCTPQNQAKYTV
jgi:hypothetical protein